MKFLPHWAPGNFVDEKNGINCITAGMSRCLFVEFFGGPETLGKQDQHIARYALFLPLL